MNIEELLKFAIEHGMMNTPFVQGQIEMNKISGKIFHKVIKEDNEEVFTGEYTLMTEI